jgi:hypothetical protein
MLDTLCGFCKQGVRSSSLLSSTRQNTRAKITRGLLVSFNYACFLHLFVERDVGLAVGFGEAAGAGEISRSAGCV